MQFRVLSTAQELMNVPISLAEMNGSLRTGSKSVLADILTTDIEYLTTIDLKGLSLGLKIDGQALIKTGTRKRCAKTK